MGRADHDHVTTTPGEDHRIRVHPRAREQTMPVPQQRDPELTRKRLTDWLVDRLPEEAKPEIAVTVPERVGFSHETLLLRLTRHCSGGPHRQQLVVRIAPDRYRVMPAERLGEEYRVLQALTATDVPVPRVYAYESNPELLGAPFYVMEYVDGWTPPDLPSYHREGPVAALDEPARESLWWQGVDVLHRIHRLSPDAHGLGFLAQSPTGPSGLTGQLDFYERHLDHFGCSGSVVALDALQALRDAQPPEPENPGLVWGDARLGNILFRGVRPAAVVDWEMAFLGPGEADLGWYLYLDRHLSEGVGARRLPGLPNRSATIERYEVLTGRSAAGHMGWYELFAGFRFALIASRVGRLLVEHGMVASEREIPLAANAARLLERTLRNP
jgi:aminoglycoside phosphotransferase (APT) family kinase protein